MTIHDFDMMRYLSGSEEEDTTTPVTAIDGLNAVIIGLAAKKSVEEGRPVKISEVTI